MQLYAVSILIWHPFLGITGGQWCGVLVRQTHWALDRSGPAVRGSHPSLEALETIGNHGWPGPKTELSQWDMGHGRGDPCWSVWEMGKLWAYHQTSQILSRNYGPQLQLLCHFTGHLKGVSRLSSRDGMERPPGGIWIFLADLLQGVEHHQLVMRGRHKFLIDRNYRVVEHHESSHGMCAHLPT